VLAKPFAPDGPFGESLDLKPAGLGDRISGPQVLLHKGPFRIIRLVPIVAHPDESVAVDGWKEALAKRRNTDDRRVRLVRSNAEGRALQHEDFPEARDRDGSAAAVLSKRSG